VPRRYRPGQPGKLAGVSAFTQATSRQPGCASRARARGGELGLAHPPHPRHCRHHHPRPRPGILHGSDQVWAALPARRLSRDLPTGTSPVGHCSGEAAGAETLTWMFPLPTCTPCPPVTRTGAAAGNPREGASGSAPAGRLRDCQTCTPASPAPATPAADPATVQASTASMPEPYEPRPGQSAHPRTINRHSAHHAAHTASGPLPRPSGNREASSQAPCSGGHGERRADQRRTAGSERIEE
jgi:hypothetical protein